MKYQHRLLPLAVLAALALLHQPGAGAAAPDLYRHPFLQSPVRGEPADLLMIAGNGFTDADVVIYQALLDTTQPLVPPGSVPPASNATLGVAPVVDCTGDRLVVRLPSFLTSGQSYGLWVRNPAGEWSEGIRINDARPLWITPDIAFENAPVASLPRELKVVGRNLQPAPAAPGGRTSVRLTGPQTFVLKAIGEVNPALDHYVVRVTLPVPMPPGIYTVEISRDGISWVPVQGVSNPPQPVDLTVLPDPIAGNAFPVSGFGCAPDDGLDDAACVQQAVDAADAAGNGVVVFGAGQWDLAAVPDPVNGGGISHGIVVPPGVDLVGAGRDVTRIVRTDQWGFVPGNCPDPTNAGQTLPPEFACVLTVFTLQGGNTVTGIHFDNQFPHAREFPFLDDACDDLCQQQGICFGGCRRYEAQFFQLGKLPWWTDTQNEPTRIDDVVFYANRFTGINLGINDGGWPLRHIFITGNEFEAYRDDILLGGNSFRRDVRFQVEDSVIAFNDFYPGGYYHPEIVQGVIASQIGAARHLDFSNNTAHPVNLAADCGTEPGGCGWRAAHFWHMNNNHEGMLVSRNFAACTGDKAGDGEAIVFDNNKNESGFKSTRYLIDATADTVTVPGPWFRIGSAASGDLDYYGEHWVQVTEGRGIGQGRKIESCCCGTACTTPGDSACGESCDEPIVITVSPPWDVVPERGRSKVSVLRVFWQVYVVDNEVDIRNCDRDNPTAPRAGVINYHGNTSDSTIEGNLQYLSDGIRLNTGYSVESYDPEKNVQFDSWSNHKFFTEVRGNLIDGEYNFHDCASPDCPKVCCNAGCCPPDGTTCVVDDYCTGVTCCSAATCCEPRWSWSGIDLRYGQYRVADSPVLSYGVSVSHNTVNNADGLRGGAITVDRGWWPPPTPGHNQYTSVLIHHNDISDLERLDTTGTCLPYSYFGLDGGIGIHLGESHTHDAVLHANTVTDACYPLEDFGTETLILNDCPPEAECSDVPGCTPSIACGFADLGIDACLLPDENVFKCSPFHTVNVRSCPCTGASCSTTDSQLVCIPDPGLPACPAESECDGAGCSATTNCSVVETGNQACLRIDQSVFGCPDGQSVRQQQCSCTGVACPSNDSHLICVADPVAAPGPPGVVPSTGLFVEESATTPGDLILSWMPSCSSGAQNYAIYEGLIGDWTSHVAIDCSDLDSDFTEQITPSPGNRYYIIVPINGDDEGSYGVDSEGAERPPGAPRCRTSQLLATCP